MNKKTIVKIAAGGLSCLFLLWGALWVYLLFEGSRRLRGITIFIEEYVAQSSALMVAACVSATIILLKLLAKRRGSHPRQYLAVAIIGFLIAGLNSLSLLATPYSIITANTEFNEAFGNDWEE
ncbi:MAG: hypothetical protein ACTSUN_03585, partial [Promethearchaeota archaeon]